VVGAAKLIKKITHTQNFVNSQIFATIYIILSQNQHGIFFGQFRNFYIKNGSLKKHKNRIKIYGFRALESKELVKTLVMLLTCLMPELEEVLAHEICLLRAARLHVHAVQGEPGLACRNNSLQLEVQMSLTGKRRKYRKI
jgi:hypothetical protein